MAGDDAGMSSRPGKRADVFLPPDEDPRENGPTLGDERTTLMEFLRGQRLTLEIKCSGLGAPALYRSAADPDGDFDGAVPDPEVVAEAWETWRAQCAFTDAFVAGAPDLGITGHRHGGEISLRELLVHMVEEYARHNGHADLLRERIDGRIGE